jgi:hypothetical protein
MLTVTGATSYGPITSIGGPVTGGAMTAGADGYVYFNFTAGTYAFTSLSAY